MNKLFKSIVAASVGVAMAIGVGAGLGREARAVYADGVTFDFTQITGFSEWGTGYTSHDVEYTQGTVTFESANHQTSTITDRPVTKGQPVSFVLAGNKQITSATFTCKQWGTKAQTITLYYSTDGGENYSSTGVTSTNFEISNDSFLPGTNALKFFFSNSSNQVGITSLSIEFEEKSSEVKYGLTYDANGGSGSMTDSNSPYNPGATVTVKDNEFTYYGHTFNHWNTLADGSGTSYDEKDTFDINANTTLYAQWEIDSSVPGMTQSNPYTVAQARAAIDANVGVDNVYVSGIVSQVDNYYSSSHEINYWISDDGTTTNQLQVYGGKGINGANFGSKDDVKVTAEVIVFGSLKLYDSKYELDRGNYLIDYSYTEPIKVLSSIELSGTYKTSFNVGESFNHDGLVVTAHYADNSTTNVTASAVVTGPADMSTTGEKTVTVSYTEGNVSKEATYTINVIEVIPLLNVDDTIIFFYDGHYLTDIHEASTPYGNKVDLKASAYVYTVVAGSKSGSFAFEYNDNYLAWESGNSLTTTTTISDSSSWYVSGDSLAECTIKNVSDSTRILQYNTGSPRFACYTGSQHNACIEVVDLTSLPEVSSVTVTGETAVNAQNASSITESYSYTVSYVDPNNAGTSEVEVTVSGGAVISTAPTAGTFEITFSANGSYTITVTSVEDQEKSISLDVTVSNIHTFVQGDAYWLAKFGAEYNSESITSYTASWSSAYNGFEVDINNGNNNSNKWDYVAFGRKDNTSVGYITTSAPIANKISEVTIDFESITAGNFNSIKLEYKAADAENWIPVGSYKLEAGEKTVSVPYLAANYLYRIVIDAKSAGSNGTCKINSVKYFNAEANDPRQHLSSVTPIATIRGTQDVVDEATVVTSLDLRFGIKIPMSDWNAIQNIEDYGVMMFLTTEAKLGTAPTVRDRYEEDPTLVSIGHRESGLTPAEDGQGNYNFTVMINVPNVSYYDYYFCVRPFVKINGQIIWLLQEDMHKSVRTMANGDNSGTNFTPEALQYLKTAN